MSEATIILPNGQRVANPNYTRPADPEAVEREAFDAAVRANVAANLAAARAADEAGVMDILERKRIVIEEAKADVAHPFHDHVARLEEELRVAMAHHGVAIETQTPLQVAQEAYDDRHAVELPQALTDLLEPRLDALEQVSGADLAQLSAETRANFWDNNAGAAAYGNGPAGYDAAMADAKLAVSSGSLDGEKLLRLAAADEPSLKILARHGRAVRRFDERRPR